MTKIYNSINALKIGMEYSGNKLKFMNAAFDSVMNELNDLYKKDIIDIIEPEDVRHSHIKVIVASGTGVLYLIAGRMNFADKLYDTYQENWKEK